MKMQIVLFSALVAACYGVTTTRPVIIDGAPSQKSLNSPRFMALAWNLATAAVNNQLKEENPAASAALVPVKVLTASLQLVSGALYELDIEMAESKCKIGANTTYSTKNCPLTGNGAKQVYHVRIVEQPWLKVLKVLDFKKIN